MKRNIPVALAAVLLLAGCDGGAETRDGLTTKERGDLDNAAAMLEDNQIYDTSADSMVPVDDSDPILPPANGAVPPGGNAAVNQAGNQTR